MSRPSIEYLNARRAIKPASGGTNYRARERAKYAPDSEALEALIKHVDELVLEAKGLGLKACILIGTSEALARFRDFALSAPHKEIVRRFGPLTHRESVVRHPQGGSTTGNTQDEPRARTH